MSSDDLVGGNKTPDIDVNHFPTVSVYILKKLAFEKKFIIKKAPPRDALIPAPNERQARPRQWTPGAGESDP